MKLPLNRSLRTMRNTVQCLFCMMVMQGCAVMSPAPTANDAATASSATAAKPPNILLLVADDLGYADIGAFGSEIPTPHLDALAFGGVRLSRFITSPACSPTRAMLLTGVDAQQAGFGNLKEELAPNQQGQSGYEGYLPDTVVTIASLLRDGGYRTYLTGKWHLGVEPSAWPTRRGFDKAFAMMTNASHFADMLPAYHPDPTAKAMYLDDDRELQTLPAEFEYSSQFYVDRMIDYLRQHAQESAEYGVQSSAKESMKDQPFFAYVAFSAPHWPLQAPDAAVAAMRGKYDAGYDVVLQRRLERQKQLGLLPQHATAAARAPKGRPWHELSAAERKIEVRGMEIYAAMVAEMDRHTGRLLDYLRDSGELDNTVVIFLSDNGAEGHDYDDTWPADAFPAIRKALDARHDFSYENMGKPNSYTLYGANWARVSAPAFRLYKAFPSEGGVRTAALVNFPPRIAANTVSDALVLAKDIAPTILELAGVAPAGDTYRSRAVEPMSGISALDILTAAAATMETAPRTHVDELLGKRSVRKGDWKLLHTPQPYGNGRWQLYNLATDLSESNDIAAEHPAKVRELHALWQEYVREHDVILPDWVSGY